MEHKVMLSEVLAEIQRLKESWEKHPDLREGVLVTGVIQRTLIEKFGLKDTPVKKVKMSDL